MRIPTESFMNFVTHRRGWRLLVALGLFLGTLSCTATEDDNTTNSFLQIVELDDNGGNFFINSDVCRGTTNVPAACTVFNDVARVTIRNFNKDQTRPIAAGLNDVILNRVRITYIRSDGRNVPGEDVPFPFDAALNFRIPIDSAATALFNIVRHQSKVESPLKELRGISGPRNGGSFFILSTLAQVEFFGNDTAGRPITLTGSLTVNFADFADP